MEKEVCAVKENLHFLLYLCTVGIFYNDSLFMYYLYNQTHTSTDTVQYDKCYCLVEVSTKLTGLWCCEG